MFHDLLWHLAIFLMFFVAVPTFVSFYHSLDAICSEPPTVGRDMSTLKVLIKLCCNLSTVVPMLPPEVLSALAIVTVFSLLMFLHRRWIPSQPELMPSRSEGSGSEPPRPPRDVDGSSDGNSSSHSGDTSQSHNHQHPGTIDLTMSHGDSLRQASRDHHERVYGRYDEDNGADLRQENQQLRATNQLLVDQLQQANILNRQRILDDEELIGRS